MMSGRGILWEFLVEGVLWECPVKGNWYRVS